MVNLFVSWLYMSAIYLIYFAYTDWTRRVIDERYNYFMVGMTCAFVVSREVSLLDLGLIVLIIVGIMWALRNRLSEGDKPLLSWLILGFGAQSIWVALGFCLILSFFLVVWAITEKIIKKKYIEIPFAVICLFAFIGVWFLSI